VLEAGLPQTIEVKAHTVFSHVPEFVHKSKGPTLTILINTQIHFTLVTRVNYSHFQQDQIEHTSSPLAESLCHTPPDLLLQARDGFEVANVLKMRRNTT